jgi:hypothetical protein
MKQKISAQVVQQYNLELEKQNAVALTFRLEQDLKDSRHQMDTKVTELELFLEVREEQLSMTVADLESFHLNRRKVEATDKSTDVEDLEPPLQPSETKQSARRASVASVRIPHPKPSKTPKPKEVNETSLEEDPNEGESESLDEIGEILPTSSRSKASKATKPKVGLLTRHLSELHKLPPSQPQNLSKPKDDSPKAKLGRRNTEFFPSKTKPIPQALPRKADLLQKPKAVADISKSEANEKEPTPAPVRKKSKEPVEEPLLPPEDPSTKLLPTYSRSRSRSLQPEVFLILFILFKIFNRDCHRLKRLWRRMHVW